MAYTTPRTWNNETVTAAKWNVEIRDNQRAIKDPPSQNFEANQGSDYSTTSTNYANIDATLSLSITTTGGDVLVGVCGVFDATGVSAALIDLTVDGTRLALTSGQNNQLVRIGGAAPATLVSFTQLITGLSAGTHTFALQWRSTAGDAITLYAGAGTANYDVHPQFFAREMS